MQGSFRYLQGAIAVAPCMDRRNPKPQNRGVFLCYGRGKVPAEHLAEGRGLMETNV